MMTQRWSDAGIVDTHAGSHQRRATPRRSPPRPRGTAWQQSGAAIEVALPLSQEELEHGRHVSCYRHARAQQLAEARLHPHWPVPHHHHRPAGPPAGRGSGNRAGTTTCCDQSTQRSPIPSAAVAGFAGSAAPACRTRRRPDISYRNAALALAGRARRPGQHRRPAAGPPAAHPGLEARAGFIRELILEGHPGRDWAGSWSYSAEIPR